jgi:hypothetical protein
MRLQHGQDLLGAAASAMKEDNEWRWPTRFEAGRYDQHRVAFLEQIESVPTGARGSSVGSRCRK